MSYRMMITFEVTGDCTHVLALSQTLQTDKGRRWGRHLLTAALETLMRWATDEGFWRLDIGEATVSKPEAVPTSAPEPMPDQVPA